MVSQMVFDKKVRSVVPIAFWSFSNLLLITLYSKFSIIELAKPLSAPFAPEPLPACFLLAFSLASFSL